MICCFFNLHEQKNAEDLQKHFDKEIENAISAGCTVFVSGEKYSEDKIFKERVENAAKFYADGEINYVGIDASNDEELKNLFIFIADWEIYSYET